MRNMIMFWVNLAWFFPVVLALTCSAVNAVPAAYNVVQRAARDGETRSITFLSSGYSAESVDIFNSDVKRCVDALYDKIAGVSAAPWNRYASLLNIYSVFQQSEEINVLGPHDTEEDCREQAKCNQGVVQNNLGCSLGIPDSSFIYCNLSAVFTLATVAPVKDIIVVLVNKPNSISSSSGSSLAMFTNEPLFLPFFAIRELSKAVANLGGEFNHGIDENSDISIANCAPSVAAARQAWEYWMKRGEVSETPTQGCFFNNYYRPTTNGCIMRNSSLEEMCPICKEQVNLALLDGKKNISLAAGRCPKENTIVHVDVSQDLQLSVGDIGTQLDVEVVWRDEDGTIINNPSGSPASLLISISTLITWTFPKKVTASIEDNSPYVRPEKRTEAFRKETIFSLVSSSQGRCDMTKCGSFNVCTSCAVFNCSLDISPNVTVVHWATRYYDTPPRRSHVIVAIAIGLSAGFAVILIFLLYYCCYYSRPHEVIPLGFGDHLVQGVTWVISIVLLVLSAYILVMVTVFFEVYLLVWKRLFIPSAVTGAFLYLVSEANLAFVSFRCLKSLKILSVIQFVAGIALMEVGLFLAWIRMNREDDNLIGYVASCWLDAVKEMPHVVEVIQSQLRCSGFFVSCLEVNSSYCPTSSESNLYANACETPFMDIISSTYIQLSLTAIITGIMLIGLAALNVIFTVRFLLLLKSARQRRSHRMNPHPPTFPFTLQEAAEARRLFYAVADKNEHTLEGTRAVQFLQRVFAVNLKDTEAIHVKSSGPLTFEALMGLCFPYVDFTRIDPRQLTPDEAFSVHGVAELQWMQHQKLLTFADAAGVLSPSTLLQIYRKYVKKHFVVEPEQFVAILRDESERDCSDAPLCEGLDALELEGLRRIWIQLNPALLDDLSNEQIDVFYQWTHGKPLRNAAHFREWKQFLDVRDRGAIGWGEFCYPFAKRARLRRARDFLSSLRKEVPPEMIPRSLVGQKYGIDVVNSVFSAYEKEVPIERLIEYLLRRKGIERKKKK